MAFWLVNACVRSERNESNEKAMTISMSYKFAVLVVSLLAVSGWLLNAIFVYKWKVGEDSSNNKHFEETEKIRIFPTVSNDSLHPTPSKQKIPDQNINENQIYCSNYSISDDKMYARAAVAYFDDIGTWWKFDLQFRAWYRSWIFSFFRNRSQRFFFFDRPAFKITFLLCPCTLDSDSESITNFHQLKMFCNERGATSSCMRHHFRNFGCRMMKWAPLFLSSHGWYFTL